MAPRPRSCAIFTPAVRLTDDPNWSAVIQIRRPEMAEIALPQSRDDIQDDDQRIVQIDHRTHLHEKGTGGGYSLARGSGTRTAGEYAGDRVVVGASCSAAGVSDSRTRFRVPAGARRRTHVEAKLKASLSGHRSGRSSGERFPPKRLPRRNAPGGVSVAAPSFCSQDRALPASQCSQGTDQSPFCHNSSGAPPVPRTSTTSPGTEKS